MERDFPKTVDFWDDRVADLLPSVWHGGCRQSRSVTISKRVSKRTVSRRLRSHDERLLREDKQRIEQRLEELEGNQAK